MLHVVGSTPEALTLADAMQGHPPLRVVEVTPAAVRAARDALTTRQGDGRLAGVNVGTPRFSVREFGELVALLAGRSVHPEVEFYANTGRHTLAHIEALGWLAPLEAAGVRLVVDTCTCVTPILRDTEGVVMTSSAMGLVRPGKPRRAGRVRQPAGVRRVAVEGRVVCDDALWSPR